MDYKLLPVSILIPTMNRPETLQRTLSTYLNTQYIPTQIVVVDQSREIGTQIANKQLLDTYSNITECLYIHQDVPSLTKARNIAFSACKEEIVICSDDDIDAYEDTVKNVYDEMQDDSISMIAGLDDNLDWNNSPIGYFLGTRSYTKRNIGHVTKSMLGRYPDKVHGHVLTEWAMGYFFVIRRSLVNNWQLQWDEKLTSYAFSEDLDFSYAYYLRSRENRLKCILSEKVHVKHMASKEYRISTEKEVYMYVLNRAYLSEKFQQGIVGRLACGWCDFWRLVQSVIRKDNPQFLFFAILYLIRNREKVYSGILDYSK